MGLSRSLVLSTLPSPTFDALIPLAIFRSVTAPFAIFEVTMAPFATSGIAAVPDKSPVSFNIPLLVASASETIVLLLFELPPPFPDATRAESTYVFTAFTDGNLISEFASALILRDLLIAFSFVSIL